MQKHDVVDLQSFRNAEADSHALKDTGTQYLPKGTTLLVGQYVIDGYLNCGGFGITYTAHDSLGRKVVIKECFPAEMVFRRGKSMVSRSPRYQEELTDIVRSFVVEAHSLANLKHDNIVHIHQIFEENNTAYMAMDYVDGPDLLDLVDSDKTLSPRHIEGLTRQMLEAIRYVHAMGLLHRDISPDNILIDPTGAPVLIDFGAAHRHAQQAPNALARMKFVKDGYSPQEFYAAGSAQGTYSDLYSFAASIYHVITGRAPADAPSRMAALAAKDPDPYTPVLGNASGFSQRFLKAIDKALAVVPEDRIQTAEEWLDRIPGRSSVIAARVFAPATAILDSFSIFDDTPAHASTRTSTGNVALLAAGAAGLALMLGTGLIVARVGGEGSASPVVTAAAPIEVEATPDHLARLRSIPVPQSLVTVWPERFSAGLPDARQRPVAETGTGAGAEPPGLTTPTLQKAPDTSLPAIARQGSVFTAPAIATSGSSPTLGPGVRPRGKPSALDGQNQRPNAPTEIGVAAVAPVSLTGPRAVLFAPPAAEGISIDTMAPEYTPSTSTVAPANSFSRWNIDVPFTSRAQTIGETPVFAITDLKPMENRPESDSWIARDLLIFALNDAPLVVGKSFSQHLLDTLKIDDDGFARASVWYRKPSDNVLEQAILAVPVTRVTGLADGTILETRKQGASWVTTVATVGAAQTDLRVGDLVVGNSQLQTRFADHRSVETALSALAQSGIDAVDFAVLRNGKRLTAAWQMTRE
ncbi:MAG: protein kinase [Pseudomonadota bacterium]